MSTERKSSTQSISTFNEKPLHAALKQWYASSAGLFEVPVGGFIIDIVQDDLLVEIQTRNFAAIKRKMRTLASSYRVRLVYPIASEKWIIRLSGDGCSQLGRRKSPKRGSLEHVFQELVSFPKLMAEPNFSLHVLLIQEEELRRRDRTRSWRRRGWVTHERRLLRVVDQRLFDTPDDLATLIPGSLDEPFTTSELAAAIAQPRWLARKMAYCLRKMGAVAVVGKRGNAILYSRLPN